eukprot:GHVQ01001110.1.p1 GENE.GHVQ01001110.1~~GHVQ01001110.1.p1  ORF type:complete len:150 (+),score=31.04 GHVQ01001110.1:37-450(+)
MALLGRLCHPHPSCPPLLSRCINLYRCLTNSPSPLPTTADVLVCYYCQYPLTGNYLMSAPTAHVPHYPSSNLSSKHITPSGAREGVGGGAVRGGYVFSCPKCGKALPKCCLCLKSLVVMGKRGGGDGGLSAVPADKW